MITIVKSVAQKINPKHLFMISVLLVNGGNYLYNLLLGRFLGPEQFADVAVLITLLLVVSFLGMTFQLVTTKFSVLFEGYTFKKFLSFMYLCSIVIGLLISVLIVIFADELQSFFNTQSTLMFSIFGIGIPVYFLMSVNRGIYQGKDQLINLSVTYQSEMIARLVITLILLFTFTFSSSVIVAIGILVSFFLGLIPFKTKYFSLKTDFFNQKKEYKLVQSFFVITAFYELTQIAINNSDILLVKHYFEAHEAGLYASLALIGRVVYFIAWMFVMLLLPKVVSLHKQGKATVPVFSKYVFYISAIAIMLVIICYVFPEQVVTIMFGNKYLAISSLLWKYALVTGVFAVANIFAYYFLSLSKYIPVLLSGVFGMLQIILIVFYHESLLQVVHMQFIAVFVLLVFQIGYFWINNKNNQLSKQ